ncbi:Protein ZINC INDUCED FACILITATOR 1 [Colletotrichum sp. SAR 10_70]|nr:Protein ZINC INDUCED FACILITATOR 1 [Colletotrichum sp. SAR 10_71]KAI8171452.1 Protein ZINC INDUCED FACILITATOR 1 [Colletotrichum sp. SAR 10_70]KAJ4994879.1 Protein ZINC INDUCED FACILITATOR 1 [Colletotrichum sp. SAR 10_66]
MRTLELHSIQPTPEQEFSNFQSFVKFIEQQQKDKTASRIADRVGRRTMLLIGFVGAGAAFALLGAVHNLGMTIAVVLLYGLTISFVYLGSNLVGTDYEHAHGAVALTGLQASGPFAGWRFQGRSMSATSVYRVAGAGMVRTFQPTKALEAMTVMDNMLIGSQTQPGEKILPALVRPTWKKREFLYLRFKLTNYLLLL